jgi:hypothetical protein
MTEQETTPELPAEDVPQGVPSEPEVPADAPDVDAEIPDDEDNGEEEQAS